MRGKLEAGYKLETGQLDKLGYKLETGQLELTSHKLEIPGPVDELEIIQKLLIPASPPQAGENHYPQAQHHATRQ